MATETKLAVTKKPSEPALAGEPWRPFESLKKEVDRLFDDFGDDFWRRPFRSLSRFERAWPTRITATPPVDVSETDKAYEITAELPGLDEKNIEVNVVHGGLTIKGEKKEKKKKDTYVCERRYGSFERCFDLPDGVDADRIEATFKKGVLKVTCQKLRRCRSQARKSRSRQPERDTSITELRGVAP
jgi:HSP20 family protein